MKRPRRFSTIRRRSSLAQRGLASFEAVMTMAIVLPLAGGLFLLGLKACKTLYQVIAGLVGWPYL